MIMQIAERDDSAEPLTVDDAMMATKKASLWSLCMDYELNGFHFF